MLDTNHNFYSKMQNSGNMLLFKGDVGKRKPGIHTLPPEEFTFGKTTGEDKEGARDLMKCWSFHQNSQKMASEPDFKLLNSMSVGNGLSTATEFRKFRKDKEIRIHTTVSNRKSLPQLPNMTFGLPLRPATPIKAVVSNFYGRVAVESLHDMYASSPAPKICRWNSTRGFELLKSSKMKGNQTSEPNLFKMRKFSGVKSKTDCWRSKTPGLIVK